MNVCYRKKSFHIQDWFLFKRVIHFKFCTFFIYHSIEYINESEPRLDKTYFVKTQPLQLRILIKVFLVYTKALCILMLSTLNDSEQTHKRTNILY